MFSLEQETAALWEEKTAQLKEPKNSWEKAGNGLENSLISSHPSGWKCNELLQDRRLPVNRWAISEIPGGSLELLLALGSAW